MNTEMTKIKGSVIAVTQAGSVVHVWVSSPTGDSSDAHILQIPTTSEIHASAVANLWRSVWDIPAAE